MPAETSHPPALLYRDCAMTWAPVNINTDDLLARLTTGMPVHVTLDPGDLTQYDLLLIWAPMFSRMLHIGLVQAKQAMIVTRVQSGTPKGSTLFGAMNFGAVRDISGGNAWVEQLLEWWLTELVRRMKA